LASFGPARAGLVALALFTVACSSSSHDSGTRPGEQAVRVKVRDFAIKAPAVVPAGNVELRVSNGGPDTHELILLRGDEKLSLRPDNLTLDEDALKPRTVGTLEDDHPGSQRVWHLHLAPGRYVLVCNMSGHYLGGMHTELTVR
jgi:uncharacterized cupredoxin-like copper-binding protein